MEMKDRIIRIASFIYNTKFGEVVILSCFILIAYQAIKSIYIAIRYHFIEVIHIIMFWVIGISSVLLIALIAGFFKKENKNKNDSL